MRLLHVFAEWNDIEFFHDNFDLNQISISLASKMTPIHHNKPTTMLNCKDLSLYHSIFHQVFFSSNQIFQIIYHLFTGLFNVKLLCFFDDNSFFFCEFTFSKENFLLTIHPLIPAPVDLRQFSQLKAILLILRVIRLNFHI